MKIFSTIFIVIISCSLSIGEKKSEEAHNKLEFLVGNWDSISVDYNSGKKSAGKSSVKWILGKTWLQWKFSAQLEKGSIEVLTLINYDRQKGQYAFYSFNSLDDRPLPHFGDWIEPKILRLEIMENGDTILVDFITKESGNFDQVHSRVTSSGETTIMSTTSYTKSRP